MPRAAYFRQAAYGVPVRMALIAALLDLDKRTSLKKFDEWLRRGGLSDPCAAARTRDRMPQQKLHHP